MGKALLKKEATADQELGSIIAEVERTKMVLNQLEAQAGIEINAHNRAIEQIRTKLMDYEELHKKELKRLTKLAFAMVRSEVKWQEIAVQLEVTGEELRFTAGVIERTWLAPAVKVADEVSAIAQAIKLGLRKFIHRKPPVRSLDRGAMLADKPEAWRIAGVSIERKRILKLRLNTQGPDETPIATSTIDTEEVYQ